MTPESAAELPADLGYVVNRAVFCREWGLHWDDYDEADPRTIALLSKHQQVMSRRPKPKPTPPGTGARRLPTAPRRSRSAARRR